MLLDTGKSMGPMAGVAINSRYTRRTWRLDGGDVVEGVGEVFGENSQSAQNTLLIDFVSKLRNRHAQGDTPNQR
jgi:hypothetical protein